jgi:hypothetical protein
VKAVRDGYSATEKPQAAWFVLAEAQWVLRERLDAQIGWQMCSMLQQSKELGVLCAYRLAFLAAEPNKAHSKALDALQRVINMHGCTPELCWYAAYTAYHAGQYERCKGLAMQAIQVGCYKGSCVSQGRIPMFTAARYDYPFDVLQFALVQLGDMEGAELAQHEAQLAQLAI